MQLNEFFDKYPDAWIVIYRTKKTEWYAALYENCYQKENPPVVEAVGNSQQVALGNLAAQLLHMKFPPEGVGERVGG